MPPLQFSDGEHGQLWDEMETIHTELTAGRVQLTAIDLRLTVHLAEVARDREAAGPALTKINDLWDWRNKMLGALGLLSVLVAVTGIKVWVSPG